MKRRTITLIAVGVVLLVVIGLILYLRFRPKPEIEAEEDPDKVKISRFDKDLIAEMVLENEHGVLTIRREGEEWKIDYPYPVDFKESNIDDVAYSFASLYSEKIVEEDPEDIVKYGLDPPLATARYTLTDGSTRKFILGNKTPAGNSYYLMAEDDPRLYAVWMNHGAHFQYKIDDFRSTDRGEINTEELVYLKLLREGKPSVEIEKVPEVPTDEIRFTMGSFRIKQPYREVQPIDSEGFQGFIQDISTVKISEFIDDDPSDLSVYGLDPPQYDYLAKTADGSEVHLLFGSRVEDTIYFKEAEGNSVYTTRDYYVGFLDVDPFSLIDKFAFILNIDDVDTIRIEGLGEKHVLRIVRIESSEKEMQTAYTFDDRDVEEDSFKDLYQKLIQPQIDSDYAGPIAEKPEFEILYTVNRGSPSEYRVSFVPYDVDFYALFVNGKSEFLVNREQVRNLVDDIEDFVRNLG